MAKLGLVDLAKVDAHLATPRLRAAHVVLHDLHLARPAVQGAEKNGGNVNAT